MGNGRIIVTGAAGILGRAVVTRLHEAGWEVAALDLAPETSLPTEAALRLGGVDLSDEATLAGTVAGLGPLAGLVNCAGGFAWETVAEGTGATWDRLYALNVRTALNACKAVLPALRAGAAIVNVGAAAAAKAELGMAAYAAGAVLYYGVTFSSFVTETPAELRAGASSTMFLAMNLFGYGVAPQFAGIASDLAKAMGLPNPLRFALVCSSSLFAIGGLFLILAGRSLRRSRAAAAVAATEPELAGA